MRNPFQPTSTKKLVGIILIALGVVLLAATGIRAITQHSRSAIEVTVPSSGTFVYTSPGVINMAGDSATVTFTGEGTIQWGFGNEDDVVAYVGESAATAVTGLVSTTEAQVKTTTASEEVAAADAKQIAAGGFNLQNSDLWLESGESEGKAVVDLVLESDTPRAIVATTNAGVAPEMTIRWNNVPVSKPIPFLAVSLLVLLFGLLLIVQEIQDEINAQDMPEPVAKRDRSFDLTEVIFPFGKSAAKKGEAAESAESAESVASADEAADVDEAAGADAEAEADDSYQNVTSAESAASPDCAAPATKSGSAWRSLWEFPQEPVAKSKPAAEAESETDEPAEGEDA